LHCAPREPFGIALLEALAAGRPVLAPASGGPKEIVTSACGVLYEPGDAAAGAAALRALLADPARARAMGQAGRERVRGRFDRSHTRAAFADAVRPLVPGRGSPPLAPEQLTVVTVTHNSEHQLEALIDSLERHLGGVRLIVVDSDSSDGSAAVASPRAWARTIELGANLGFGTACNRGLAEVTGPVTALLNPDIELIDDSLLHLAAQALGPDHPPRLLAPLVLNGDGTRQDSVHPVPGSAADRIRALIPPALVPGPVLAPWRSRSPRRVGWAVGAALVARTETLRRLGPFDESIFMYGEDLELGLRAAANGVATWFDPRSRVLHHRAHSSAIAFGGEPFEMLARARHDVVARRLGPRRAQVDDRAQKLTFASRRSLKRALGRPTERESMQLDAMRSLRGGQAGDGPRR
jgi:N-acetylglucosaminyl-diphospho-decaprenol L-rhamnosyltransferase